MLVPPISQVWSLGLNKPTKDAILIVKAENRHYSMWQHWDEDKGTSNFPKSSFRGLNRG